MPRAEILENPLAIEEKLITVPDLFPGKDNRFETKLMEHCTVAHETV
jgi:hypothetical protein